MLSWIAKVFREGDIGMYPIAVVGVFSVVVIADRIRYLFFTANFDKDGFVQGMKKYILQGNLQRALTYVGTMDHPLARIIKAGLLKVKGSDEDVQAAIDEEALRELPKIERRTGYLAMLGNVATLIGLLGTITGLIKSFGAVAQADPAEKSAMLAKGISEAMNCTAFGLVVAIPSLIAYSLLQGRTQKLVDDINETSVTVLNLIVTNRDKLNLKVVDERDVA
jgi:biopolymer transport protein ExbB/TolQ